MMNKPKLVIIGGDAAGMSAASKVRRENSDYEIVVFEKSGFTSYSACGIPYFISGKVGTYEELIVRSPEEFIQKYKIDVRVFHEVIEVDTKNNQVLVRNLNDKTQFWETYDQLLIATGGKSFCPEVENREAEGIFGVQSLKGGIKLDTFIKKNKPKTAVIVGGGYIGLEMAEALIIKGLKVTLINREPEIMNTLDPDMGKIVNTVMTSLGVKIYVNEELNHFEAKENRVTAVVTNKKTIKTDLVILGMGTSPNTAFLHNSKINLTEKGAIKVNREQRTNVKNVWAAGDCAMTYNLVSKKPFYIALGTVANKTGLVAGTNISGQKARFPGVVATAVCKICVYEVARTGLLEKELLALKMEYIQTIIKTKSRAHYYPDAKDIYVKLLAEKGTGKLLGGQIIGEEGAAKRIDVLATALTNKLTLQNIIDLDLSYAPPFSPVWDPVQTAARKLINEV
ncbi:NADPH-dependent 2,4-dienoyl-CoA reductase/sulfur reductase-like enzyme [Flavobacterium arsenatis]|uniref:NADPH-dependent 2,4-dienoyl-CoA reductase/sulfur reductase-like enzyme n=1 Tax=Flavobacterium arsenatis TaxID=1484332 RepID=A0ABU1TQI4_9FLAO|nr:CoA-disulfide reductase [Flavobacterium arsenatis]MDR6968052.1 NADPH-dependent 2,4-dienoyl-CoA reductase/sulfur reductase-like enzyme [Flavobacterium arsenatis]